MPPASHRSRPPDVPVPARWSPSAGYRRPAPRARPYRPALRRHRCRRYRYSPRYPRTVHIPRRSAAPDSRIPPCPPPDRRPACARRPASPDRPRWSCTARRCSCSRPDRSRPRWVRPPLLRCPAAPAAPARYTPPSAGPVCRPRSTRQGSVLRIGAFPYVAPPNLLWYDILYHILSECAILFPINGIKNAPRV